MEKLLSRKFGFAIGADGAPIVFDGMKDLHAILLAAIAITYIVVRCWIDARKTAGPSAITVGPRVA